MYFEDLGQGHLVTLTLAQRSLGLNALMSETNRLVTLITRTDINCQMSLPWSYLPWSA